MKLGNKHVVLVLAAVALLPGTGTAFAQQSEWRPFVSVTGAYEGNGDLDGGGHFSVWNAFLRAGATRDLGGGNGVGVTFNYDYNDYSFSNPVAFGGVAPWNIVQRYGVAVPLTFGLSDGWSIGFVPSVDWFRENGAKSGDSLVWGGVVSGTKRFADGNRIGFGVGVYDRIEKTQALPFLLVDWRFSDRWRLVNPLAAGPTGPAGLELDYTLGSGWDLGVGVAYRSTRFRLSETGPVPNGVGVQNGVPLFLRATYAVRDQMTLHFFAGVVTAGELRVADSNGNWLRKVDYDPAPFVGVNLTARF
ncbi:MAG TPA: hypothetical protein VML91_12375 [Burkholderiales bacterium]|nr:hypothetical protein [Burkholderiales bacterium]